MRNISERLFVIALTLTVIIVLCVGTLIDTDRIEIYKSYSTGECVAMITYNSDHPRGLGQDCPDELPQRYKHIWVQ
jgi:hypothetical protein